MIGGRAEVKLLRDRYDISSVHVTCVPPAVLGALLGWIYEYWPATILPAGFYNCVRLALPTWPSICSVWLSRVFSLPKAAQALFVYRAVVALEL